MSAAKVKTVADELAGALAFGLIQYKGGLITAREFVESIAAVATAARNELPTPSAGEIDLNTGLRYQ